MPSRSILSARLCFWKQYLSYWRNPQYNIIKFLMTAVTGFLFGLLFWEKGDKMSTQQDLFNLLGAMYAAIMFLGVTNISAVQSVVAVERTAFYREKAAGMYSPLSYAFAQVGIETIYVAIQSLIYTLLLYSMIGFQWKADKFFMFFYFMQIPIWWRWYYWASPPAWTIYGLVTSQMGDETSPIQVPGLGDIPLKEYLNDLLGFKYGFLGVVAVCPSCMATTLLLRIRLWHQVP